jgi:bifunctional DNA-binding transcriptional regulator/antitoxin component of YhaV-PrlF toxin-antitoxin module
MATLKKIGGSYYVLIPKGLAEFYGWIEAHIIIEVDSEKILVKKVS